jgi:hypothetical protein
MYSRRPRTLALAAAPMPSCDTEQQRYRANATDNPHGCSFGNQHGICFGMKRQRLATIKRRVMTEEAAALGSNAQRKQKTENLL